MCQISVPEDCDENFLYRPLCHTVPTVSGSFVETMPSLCDETEMFFETVMLQSTKVSIFFQTNIFFVINLYI